MMPTPVRALAFFALLLVWTSSILAANLELQRSTGVSATGGSSSVSPTGAFAYAIPITVPPGRLGMAPEVSVQYNSQSGSVWPAVGWTLELGSIRRYTKDGLDYGASDFEIVVGAQARRLVHVVSNEYRLRLDDGEFLRAFYNATSKTWTVYEKSGTLKTYGSTMASREHDPGNFNNIYSWKLSRVEEPNGNYMSYVYTRSGNRLLPASIAYAGNDGAQLSPTNEVRFNYSPTATPIYVWNRPGMRHAPVHILDNVETWADGALAARYDFDVQESGMTGRLLLNSVQRFGDDGTTAFPETTFSYSGNAADLGQLDAQDLANPFPSNGYWLGANQFKVVTGDFSGDGKTDLIHFVDSQYAHVWESLGNGHFTIRAPFPNDGYGVNGYNDSYHYVPGDFNADGKMDLFHVVNSSYGHVWTSNGDGTFGIGPPFPNSGYGMNGEDDRYDFRPGDFNGDGATDLIHFVSHEYVHVWFSNLDGTFSIANWFPNHPPQVVHPVYPNYGVDGGSDYTYVIADHNGDGLDDLVHFVSGDYVHVWISNGDGTFEIEDPLRARTLFRSERRSVPR